MATGAGILSRMKTICENIEDLPEIFLPDDDDDDDEEAIEPAEDDEGDDDAAVPEDDEADENKENANDGKSGEKKSKGQVFVEAKCDDKNGQKYMKWIVRGIRAIAGPLASKFNLNLKVNLDMNMGTGGKQEPQRAKNSTAPPNVSATEKKPSEAVVRRQKERERMRELEKENRLAEKFCARTIEAYSALKKECQQQLESKDAELGRLRGDVELAVRAKDEQEKLLAGQVKESRASAGRLQMQVANLQNQMKSLSEQNDKQNTELQDAQQTAEACKTRLSELETKCALANATVDKLQPQVNRLESEKLALRQGLDHSEQTVKSLRNAIRVLESSQKSSTSIEQQRVAYSCPLCQTQFDNLADLQLHAEECL